MTDTRLRQAPGAPQTAEPLARFHRFRAIVLGDAALQKSLGRTDDLMVFADLVAQAGRRNGFHFEARDVHSLVPPASHELPPLKQTVAPPAAGWLPIKARWVDARLVLDWAYFGDERLREPFYDDSVRRCLRKPFNRLFACTTPFGALETWLPTVPTLAPSGFIFHMSRCGSTLVARMLAALAETIVISEADPIDVVVRAREQRPDLGEEEHGNWLKQIVAALGQPRDGRERHLFVKLDSWHSAALPLFRRAFPSTPWVFVYRDPVEVLVSHLRQPGLQMLPGQLASLLDIEPTHEREVYCARVLAKICEPILRHWPAGGGLLVNYRELPDALWTRIMPHFRISASKQDRAAMTQAAARDAKTPGLLFSPDGAAKQRAAAPAARAAAAEWLGGIYSQLESLRATQ
jgi:hypothetical protein